MPLEPPTERPLSTVTLPLDPLPAAPLCRDKRPLVPDRESPVATSTKPLRPLTLDRRALWTDTSPLELGPVPDAMLTLPPRPDDAAKELPAPTSTLPPLLLLLEPLIRERRPPVDELEKPADTSTSAPCPREEPAMTLTLPALPWLLEPEPTETLPEDSEDAPDAIATPPEGFDELKPVSRVKLPLDAADDVPETMAIEPLLLEAGDVVTNREPDLPRALPPLLIEMLPPEAAEDEEPPRIATEPPAAERLEPEIMFTWPAPLTELPTEMLTLPAEVGELPDSTITPPDTLLFEAPDPMMMRPLDPVPLGMPVCK